MPAHSRANIERLAALDRLAEAGDAQAAGEARRLRRWMREQEQVDQKRADDRMKVLIGAYTASELAAGRRPSLDNPSALLAALDGWLVRPAERLAVLGSDGNGSEALRRVLGLPQADSLSGGSEAAQSDDGEAAPRASQAALRQT